MKRTNVTYSTPGEFREALGVSKATMSRYTRRDDWPVDPAPPWNASAVATVNAWRKGLREDRAKEHRTRSAAEAERELAAMKSAVEMITGLRYPEWVKQAVDGWRRLARETENDLKAAMSD